MTSATAKGPHEPVATPIFTVTLPDLARHFGVAPFTLDARLRHMGFVGELAVARGRGHHRRFTPADVARLREVATFARKHAVGWPTAYRIISNVRRDRAAKENGHG